MIIKSKPKNKIKKIKNTLMTIQMQTLIDIIETFHGLHYNH